MTHIDLRAVKSGDDLIKQASQRAQALAKADAKLIPELAPLLADLSQAQIKLLEVQQREAKRQTRREIRKRQGHSKTRKSEPSQPRRPSRKAPTHSNGTTTASADQRPSRKES